MATAGIPGALLGYDDSGSGPVVVLVHAGLADRRMWDRQFAVLSRTHRVIRYDWRGYGESSDLSAEVAHHEDLLALMDAREITSATLVGASMGGCYAVDAALAQPARVDGLALVSAVFSGFTWPAESLGQLEKSARAAVPADRLSRYAQRDLDPDPADVTAMAAANVALMVAGPGRSLDDLEPAVREQALQMCADVFTREWSCPAFPERHLQPPAVGRLREIAVPTLVVNGLCDLGGVQAAADQLTEGIAGARRLDLERTGHLASVERPAELTAAIEGLVGSL
jgi:pimeloyl-ACP methyl ester carboxylesterase